FRLLPAGLDALGQERQRLVEAELAGRGDGPQAHLAVVVGQGGQDGFVGGRVAQAQLAEHREGGAAHLGGAGGVEKAQDRAERNVHGIYTAAADRLRGGTPWFSAARRGLAGILASPPRRRRTAALAEHDPVA